MHNYSQKIKTLFGDKKFVWSFCASFAFLFISFVINYYAGIYATERASNAVTDIILSNIRVYDVDRIFIYGPFVLWLFVAIFAVQEPKRVPFILKSIALFVVIRSVFITLTHIGPFPTEVVLAQSDLIKKFAFGGDLFFSAHTGLPFLMALIFWKDKYLRWIFIAASIFFGIIVLMGHLHYSIDVLAAFFITYSIFHIAVYVFKEDWERFSN